MSPRFRLHATVPSHADTCGKFRCEIIAGKEFESFGGSDIGFAVIHIQLIAQFAVGIGSGVGFADFQLGKACLNQPFRRDFPCDIDVVTAAFVAVDNIVFQRAVDTLTRTVPAFTFAYACRLEGGVAVLRHGEIGEEKIEFVVKQAAFDAEFFRVACNRRKFAAAFGLAVKLGYTECLVVFGNTRIAGISINRWG